MAAPEAQHALQGILWMRRVGKRLSARRASLGMAIALAQKCNTAGERLLGRSRALTTEDNHSLCGWLAVDASCWT